MEFEHSFAASLNRDRLVAVLDADPGTCESLSILFRLEGFQIAVWQDGPGFLAGIERRQPDIALINLRVGPDDGLVLFRALRARWPGTPAIMLADSESNAAAVQAMRAGAHDVISKPINAEALARAVQDALRRRAPGGIVQEGRPLEIAGFAQLTAREREVLQPVTRGKSNKEAGRQLGISPRTIEVHRARVMEKLGARNTAELMRIVLTR